MDFENRAFPGKRGAHRRSAGFRDAVTVAVTGYRSVRVSIRGAGLRLRRRVRDVKRAGDVPIERDRSRRGPPRHQAVDSRRLVARIFPAIFFLFDQAIGVQPATSDRCVRGVDAHRRARGNGDAIGSIEGLSGLRVVRVRRDFRGRAGAHVDVIQAEFELVAARSFGVKNTAVGITYADSQIGLIVGRGEIAGDVSEPALRVAILRRERSGESLTAGVGDLNLADI